MLFHRSGIYRLGMLGRSNDIPVALFGNTGVQTIYLKVNEQILGWRTVHQEYRYWLSRPRL